MIVRYGNYQHAINTTGLTISQEVLEDEAQVPRQIVTNLNLEGRLRNSRLSIQPKFDSAAFSSLTKRMEAATAEADEHYREANKYPKPKYSSVSEIKYLASVEELKGLQIQLDTANEEMAAAIAAKSLSRLEKTEADIDRIDAAMEKLYAIRNRNAPSSLK